jgi:ParB-like chromosome segregation protein Spo0J
VSDKLLTEYGFLSGAPPGLSYRCTCVQARLEPLVEISGPAGRKLNEAALRSLLAGMRDGVDLPPVVVYRQPGRGTATLIHGTHRWRISLAVGFPYIPCMHLTADEAAEYGL